MEFIKVGKRYMIKGSNGYMISETQKEQYEKNQINPKHEPCECNKKKSTSKKGVQNDIIEETNTTI